jgi:hypothetical protein
LALEVEQRLLKLGVDHVAVGDDQHGIEQLPVRCVVQLRQEVGGPGDGVGFAGASGVLDEVLPARSVAQDRCLELARDI